jgi:hypothetical protein
MSQNVYTDEQRYNESPAPWSGYYVQTLSNLKEVKDLTTGEVSPITREYGAPVNQRGVAELMSAFIMKRVTDTWGPVPYTQALGKEETITPNFTDQEEIYRDLIERVKNARDILDTSKPGPTGDAVYGGDVAKWKKFANSFILTLTIQLTKKFPGSNGFAATEFKNALDHSAGVIEDVEDEMWYQHSNQPGALNPFSQLRGADYNISKPVTDAMSGQADQSTITFSSTTYDERLDVYRDTSIAGRPYGYANYPDTSSYANISGQIWNPSAPLPYMTAAYTYLNRAEAAQRGWTSESVEDMLEEGIEHSYATIDAHYDDGSSSSGLLQSDGSSYANQRWADAQNVGELQVIAEEKWVALFPMGFQAWSEWRRTGYPQLQPSPDPFNDGTIPRRYLYPAKEPGVNTQSYESGVQKLEPATDNNTSRFCLDRN